jgi:mono/diheme cytochrome c family protein
LDHPDQTDGPLQKGETIHEKYFAWAAAGLLLGVALLGAPSVSQAQSDQGKKIFTDKCLPCHGEKGDGKGPMSSIFDPKPGSFSDPKFWQGDVNKKITESVTKGENQMVPVNLKPDEIKAVIDYMTQTFKK